MRVANGTGLGLAGMLLAIMIGSIALVPPAVAQEVKVTLSGSQEIPPATTSGSGTGVISVGADMAVSGTITVTGFAPTVAHIHEAPAGANGPIVVPLVKTGDNVWSIPPGTKLTQAQFDAFKAGHLYYNVHSEAYRGGEIRGQIKP